MNVRNLLLAAVLALPFLAADRAAAQCGYGGGYGAYGAWDVGRLYGVLADRVPYYAAFPPVYYSMPVARTYGYSPFAYPPGTMTPEVETMQPLSIENPYYKPAVSAEKAESGATPAADRTTAVEPAKAGAVAVEKPAPLVIVNPFYRESNAPQVRTALYAN